MTNDKYQINGRSEEINGSMKNALEKLLGNNDIELMNTNHNYEKEKEKEKNKNFSLHNLMKKDHDVQPPQRPKN